MKNLLNNIKEEINLSLSIYRIMFLVIYMFSLVVMPMICGGFYMKNIIYITIFLMYSFIFAFIITSLFDMVKCYFFYLFEKENKR